jgi:hypothetical protein
MGKLLSKRERESEIESERRSLLFPFFFGLILKFRKI